jgi:phospholipid/cholesterol/gamma-HCH transport system substrate-binding protein
VKLTNETKVGALAIFAIVLLILGFNFLKGVQLFSKSFTIYAKYENIQGLTTSNPVYINGLKVGNIGSISSDKNMKELLVKINIQEDINIPSNSVALIVPNPLAATKIEIKLGDNSNYLKNNDTINTDAKKNLLDDVMQKVDPVLFEVKNAVATLDTLLGSVNKIINDKTRNNINEALENINKITASVLVSANSLQNLLDEKNGSLSKTMKNASSFTGNLAENNSKITSLINNLNKTTSDLSQVNFKNTLTNLDSAIFTLKETLSKINNAQGSAGMLINDPALYKNLTSTTNKLNTLLDDVRLHPKRYVSISVFGKKDKTAPLMSPLPDTSETPQH